MTEPPSSLSWRGGALTVCRGAFTLRGPTPLEGDAATLGGPCLDAAVAAVGCVAVVEALAALKSAEPLLPTTPEPRPSVPRVFGVCARGGAAPVLFIYGDRAQAFLPGQPAWSGTLAELAAGLPAPARAALGDKDADAAEQAAQTLLELPCDCGTGATREEQFRHLRRLASLQHPSAPIEHRFTVARCCGCGGLYTFEVSGDSHYGLSCLVHRFSGQAA